MAKNGSTSTRRDFIKAAGWGAAAASLAPLGAAGEPAQAEPAAGKARRLQAQVRPRTGHVRGERREERRSTSSSSWPTRASRPGSTTA
ncbi:MAG: twin-arginine translocation signal domain-containing protein [Ignavibacteriales bacterium]|nr:twin-arginine translocation signal domain-containing protein [Ignavibacteriales bacterium]